jgi:uncharacterized protein YqeY
MADANLKQTVQTQMVAAMKAGDKTRTSVLRMVLSEIKRVEADDPAADPARAVEGYSKKLKKTMEDMERLKQPERVAALAGELAIIAEFLPKEMDDAVLAGLVDETLAPMGVITQKDMGRAIGAVMKAVAAKGASADAGKVRALVQSKVT